MPRNIIFIILSLQFLVACAPFEKIKLPRNANPITKKSFDQHSSSYSFYPSYTIDKNGNPTHIKNRKESNLSLLFNEGNFDGNCIDSVRIQLVTSKEVKVDYFYSAQIVKTNRYSGKIKRNGFFYPNCKNMDCRGVPVLFGGCTTDRIRLMWTKDGSLIVQRSYETFGAILIIFGSEFSFNETFLFISPKESQELLDELSEGI